MFNFLVCFKLRCISVITYNLDIAEIFGIPGTGGEKASSPSLLLSLGPPKHPARTKHSLKDLML